MEFSIVFSYFDPLIGPTTFMVKPGLEIDLLDQISSLMDIHTENSIFYHGFANIHTFNITFNIYSLFSRGKNILCMLTVCLSEMPKNNENLNNLLFKYVKKFQEYPNLNYLLNKKQIKQNLSEQSENFEKILSTFYHEIKCLPELSKKVIPTFIPGFFNYNKEHSTHLYENWVETQHQFDFIKKVLIPVIHRNFQEAYQEWKSIEPDTIHDEKTNIQYLLLGSYISYFRKKYKLACNFADKALFLAEKTQKFDLHIDAILNLFFCSTHLGMIMIFETAFSHLDSFCGLSDYLLKNYKRFENLLYNSLEIIETKANSIPNYKIRYALIQSALGRLIILKNKSRQNEHRIKNGIILLEQSSNTLNDSPFIHNIIENHVSIALAYEVIKKFEKSTQHYDKAFSFALNLPDFKKYEYKAWILQRQGWNHFRNGFFNETMKKFQQSEYEISQLSNQQDQEIYQARTQVRIGHILAFKKDDFNKIITLFENSEIIFVKFKEYIELARLYYVMGDLYKVKGKTGSAFEYYEKCEKIAKTINDKETIGISLVRKAKIKVESVNLEGSLNLYLEAISYFEEINHPQFLGITYGEIGAVYQSLGKNELAIKYYEQGLNSFASEGNELESYWILYKMVTLNLNENYLLANKYANKLIDMRKLADSEIINQASRLVEALLLSKSPNPRKHLKAIFLLEQVVEEEIIQHQLTHAALSHLCDLLLEDIIKSKDLYLIEDLNKFLNKLILLAQEIHNFYEIVEIKIIQAKISLIQNNIEKAKKIHQEAMKIILENNFTELHNNLTERSSFLRKDTTNLSKLNEIANLKNELQKIITIFNI